MKTEYTCVNCAVLECNVRSDCEDNELLTENQPNAKGEDTNITFQVVAPNITEKVVTEKRIW